MSAVLLNPILLNRLEPKENKKGLWFLHQTRKPRPSYYSTNPKQNLEVF